MKTRHLLTLGFAATFMVSCAGNLPATQSDTGPMSEKPAVEANSASSETQAADQLAKQVKSQSGSFVSGEHRTEGTVQVGMKDGKTFVELGQGFKTSEMGPDLVVALHRSTDVIGSTKPPAYPLKEGEYVVIAPLKKFSGAQSYEIPKSIDLGSYQSVVIWCRKFNATFGAATLGNR